MRSLRMTGRSGIKKSHERAIIKEFLDWTNMRRRTKYSVISEPDPPDAIIHSARKTTWIEVADVFWTDSFAQDKFSYVTPGEHHRPMHPGPYQNMDMEFAKRFIEVVGKKLSKASYALVYQRYGPGILVLCIHHPWFDGYTIEAMNDLCRGTTMKEVFPYIGEVYIMFSSLNRARFRKWIFP